MHHGIGYILSGNIINCYNVGDIEGTTSNLGAGIAVVVSGNSFHNFYNAGSISNGASLIYFISSNLDLGEVYSLKECASDIILTTSTDYEPSNLNILSEDEMKSEILLNMLNDNRGTLQEWTLEGASDNKGYPVFKISE